jgi:hypothetical protein
MQQAKKQSGTKRVWDGLVLPIGFPAAHANINAASRLTSLRRKLACSDPRKFVDGIGYAQVIFSFYALQ